LICIMFELYLKINEIYRDKYLNLIFIENLF